MSASVNSLPNDKILDWYKLKTFADDKIKVLKMMVFVFENVKSIVGEGENAVFPFVWISIGICLNFSGP